MEKEKIKNSKNDRMEFRCSTEEKEKIEKLADYLEMPPSTLVRNLVLASYDDAIIFKKLGLLKGAKQLIDFKKKYSSIFQDLPKQTKINHS